MIPRPPLRSAASSTNGSRPGGCGRRWRSQLASLLPPLQGWLDLKTQTQASLADSLCPGLLFAGLAALEDWRCAEIRRLVAVVLPLMYRFVLPARSRVFRF